MSLPQNTSVQPPVLMDADDKISRSKQRQSSEETSYSDKILSYTKSRFDKENWFGSAILIESWLAGYNRLRSSLVRQVHGQDQPDHMRALGYAIPLLGYTWSFFSKRGAKFPDGDTVPERMADAMHHPHESSNQFEFLVFLPGNLISLANNIQKGLKAYGIGLKDGEKAYAPEKIRLVAGLLTAAWQACVGYGHFRKRGEAPQEDNKPVKRGFIGIIQKVWRHDRVLFIGSVINMTFPFVSLVEGKDKLRTSRKEAGYILRGALIGLAGTAAYNYYIFQRIARSNFGAQEANEEIGPAEERAGNINIPPPPPDERNNLRFAHKVLEQKQQLQARTIA